MQSVKIYDEVMETKDYLNKGVKKYEDHMH